MQGNDIISIIAQNPLQVVIVAVSAVILVLLVVNLISNRKIYARYNRFMRGQTAESLEDKIDELYMNAENNREREMAQRDVMKVFNKGISTSLQKVGMVKYNAFDGMGGRSSFVIAVLDRQNSGFLLNVMHSRTGCYVYAKEIIKGVPDGVLSDEEREALQIAAKKTDKYFGRE